MVHTLKIDNVKYNLWTPQDEEKEFQPIVKENSNDIFGQDTIYFDIGLELRSLADFGSKPDGFVIDLLNNKWYVVEVELSKHSPYEHIVNQLTRFINGIENPETKELIVDSLWDEIDSKKMIRAHVEERVKGDIHRWLSKLLSERPKIVVIIEERTKEVLEACKFLMNNFETHILELKTFVRDQAENVHAYLLEPLQVPEKDKGKRGNNFPPKHHKDWQSKLDWTNDNVKNIVKALTTKILVFKDVKHRPGGRSYIFYKGDSNKKFAFTAFILTKGVLKVRIRADPTLFKDPQKWTGDKVYKGWFFKQGQEKEFSITNEEQIPYAMGLIKQSYDILL